MPGEDVEAFASGVFAHEITHTLHIAEIAAAMQETDRRHDVPESVDDDLLQRIFTDDAEYVAAFERELALYANALRATDPAEARELVRSALDASRERRGRHFRGEHAFSFEAEPLFLTMEGVACWVAHSVAVGPPDPLEFAGSFWSQRRGLLLFLLLDRLDAGWKERVFAAPPPDPFAMLEAPVYG